MKENKTRKKILDTVEVLFYTQGYTSTGINQVIAEAGIAKATLYQHFLTKDDLCVAYLTSKQNSFFENLTDYTKKGKNSKEKILMSFDFINKMMELKDYRGCPFLNIISEIGTNNKKIFEAAQNQKNTLRIYFKNLYDSPNDKNNTSDKIYLLFEVAMVESQVQQSLWPIKMAKEMAVQFLE